MGPEIVRWAMRSLEPEQWDSWFEEYLNEHNLGYEDFLDAAALFGKAMSKVIESPKPRQALAEVGFSDLPPPIQVAIFTRIGQAFLAGVWAGVKDVSSPEDSPPAAFDDLLEETQRSYEDFIKANPDDTGQPADCAELPDTADE